MKYYSIKNLKTGEIHKCNTKQEIAKYLHIHKQTLYRHLKKSNIVNDYEIILTISMDITPHTIPVPENFIEIWEPITLVQRFKYAGSIIDRYLNFSETGYEISNLGRLRNKKLQILSDLKIRNGYIVNTLYDNDGKMCTVQRHSLVASAFMKDSYKKNSYIHHINNNKLDNTLSNLEWKLNNEKGE